MTNEEKLYKIKNMGYKINLIEEEGGTVHVEFDSICALETYRLPNSYSRKAYTDQEITLDVLPVLMQWAGLIVKEVLEYK